MKRAGNRVKKGGNRSGARVSPRRSSLPGEVTRVHFEIPAVMHTFKPGHRIMIKVENS